MVNRRTGLLCALGIVIFLGLASFSSLVPGHVNGTRTGDMGNEPATGFSEGEDIFRIYHQDGTHDTTFQADETMYVSIVTDRVGNTGATNRLRIRDYLGGQLHQDFNAFTKEQDGQTFYYNATVDLSTIAGLDPGYYLVTVLLEAIGGGPGFGNTFSTSDVIMISGTMTDERYIKTYDQDTYGQVEWIYNPTDVVYTEMWAGTAGALADGIHPGDSEIRFANYQGDEAVLPLEDLQNYGDFGLQGDYYRFSYDLDNDLAGDIALTEGHWYTISATLIDDNGDDVIMDWTVQIYINIAPVIDTVGVVPETVDVYGTNTVDIYGVFEDGDAGSVNEPLISIHLREPDDTSEINLGTGMDNADPDLDITYLGEGRFNASYTWDPQDTQSAGLYDVYFEVEDAYQARDTSGYADNGNILELYNSNINNPEITDTYCEPDAIAIDGTTTINGLFTDVDDPPASEFTVTFKVRDSGNVVYTLVSSKGDGGAGELGGTVTITKTAALTYKANYTFSPLLTWDVGVYDLQFSVSGDDGGWAMEGFENNPDGLIIRDPNNDPTMTPGGTYCDPSTVTLGNQTTIYAEFTDLDDHDVSAFTVTFSVQAPNNDEIIIVDAKVNGGLGELGGTLVVEKTSATQYVAYYTFTVPDTWAEGKYDLYFETHDDTGRVVEDPFNENNNELEVRDWRNPPETIETTVLPSSVDRVGDNYTTIYGEFSDIDGHTVDEFLVTFKIRHEDGDQITIVDSKKNGEPGEFGETLTVEISGSQYIASYIFDPDASVPTGTYDLFFKVEDPTGQEAEHDYDQNQDELTIMSSNDPPEISDVKCLPSSIDKIGENPTTIFAEFSDSDTPNGSVDLFNVTFKIRSPSDEVTTLVDDKGDGGIGEFGGELNIDYSGTKYTASYNWDPTDIVETGKYDLHAVVTDNVGNYVEHGFEMNEEELEIVSSAEPPEIELGDTTCIPSSVNKIGEGKTQMFCEFTDTDTAGVDNFTVTFKVRSPSGEEFLLVNNSHNGGSGEYGGTLAISYSGTVYIASYFWDPPSDIETGDYDLYTEVRDEHALNAVDPFDENKEELEVVTSANPPEIQEVGAIPSSVVIGGTGTTQIYGEFTDQDQPPVGNFTVTIKVRSPKDTVLVLVDDISNGEAGEYGGNLTVTSSGTAYTATYVWDPPTGTEPGAYDLYFMVKDGTLATAVSGFDENKNELELEVAGNPPTLEDGAVEEVNTGQYNFTVIFSDPDGDMPEGGVTLVVGNETYVMTEVNASDTDTTDGKEYYAVVDLEPGAHPYSFLASDGEFDADPFAPSDPLTVPSEDGDGGDGGEGKEPKESETNAMWLLLAIMLVIIIILVLLLTRKKGKEEEPSEFKPVEDEGEEELKELESEEEKGEELKPVEDEGEDLGPVEKDGGSAEETDDLTESGAERETVEEKGLEEGEGDAAEGEASEGSESPEKEVEGGEMEDEPAEPPSEDRVETPA